MANTCDIVKKWGLGERCTSPALEGDHRCKLHRHLETLCGPLPTEKGDFRPERLKKAKKVVAAVAEAVVGVEAAATPAPVPEAMAARATLDGTVAALAESTTPEAKPKAKRSKKSASPKA